MRTCRNAGAWGSRLDLVTRLWLVAWIILCLIPPTHADSETETAPDIIVVKGDRLRGNIVDLEPDGVLFETIYGSGNIRIPYADIEQIFTPEPYRIRHGDERALVGQILGVENGQLLVGGSVDTARRIDMATIKRGVSLEKYDQSWYARMKQKYPFWQGDIHLGFDFEEGAVEKRKIEVGVLLERHHAPTHYRLELDYAFETQGTTDSPRTTTKDEFQLIPVAQYDFSDHGFFYALPGVSWDKPRGIKMQLFPSAGGGYRLIDWYKINMDLSLGLGIVYSDYEDFPDETYPAGFLGINYRQKLPRGATLRLSTMYMPDIKDIHQNWLWRSRATLTVPLIDPISVRLRLENVNDNVPSPEVGNNKFTTFLGLALKL
ncbi:MAG: DUF481 domain-containing protein [Pseudomonadota bacterium]|nr:DUF481 domain-containing protein [Pseudomonadota bacterium]